VGQKRLPQEIVRAFRTPLILFAEQVVAPGAQIEINQDALSASRDMIIDYLAISEDSFSTNNLVVGLGQTYLHMLDVNWGVAEGSKWLPGNNFGRIELFHNHPGDRSAAGIMNFANRFAAWGGLRWKHSEPWIYNPIDNLTIDFLRPAMPAGIAQAAAEPLRVSFSGVGQKTGLRRDSEVQGINVPQALGGAAPLPGTFSDNQRANNIGTDPIFMTDMSVSFPNRQGGGGAWNADIRLLNHFRMRVVPSVGDGWSRVQVPLIFYGVDMSPPYRVAYHKPEGGPIALEAGRKIAFDIVNNSAVTTNIQVALIGRIAPELGSAL